MRTGTAGDVLFAARPPARPLTLVVAADQLFPSRVGPHLVGPSLRLSWLSFGSEGSLLALDFGTVVEIPTGKLSSWASPDGNRIAFVSDRSSRRFPDRVREHCITRPRCR